MTAQATSIISDFEDILADDLDPQDLTRTRIPLMILSGAGSPEVSLAIANRLRRCLPAATHLSLAGLGHMAPVIQPDLVAPPILAHVAGCQAALAANLGLDRQAA
ncbi:MAG: hypothetical protein AAF557_20550 [Pseudomonadota bacterium]